MSQNPPLITVHTSQGPRQVPVGTTVATLLLELNAAHTGIATAVNGAFVARHEREHHVLRDGDILLCFAPITGG
ncbi:MAG: sulfur carrier protein ThiS [Burkholderiales bacterium]|nr:sulfur carrier protein ThiS [Burkholderiales bacterium]